MVDLPEPFGTMDGVMWSTIEDWCESLGMFLRGLGENSRVGLNKSINEAFCAGSIGSPFHANTAIDGTTLHFLEGTASNDGDGSTKSKDVVDPPADRKAIEL